jgi:quercetin dioxygenase-like cupin family protein
MLARFTFVLPLSCVAITLVTLPALAQEKKEEYVTKAERNVLLEKPLPGMDGKVVSVNHFRLPPEYVGGKHYHSGPTYVYVLKGTLTIEEEGKPTQIFETGQLYEEPIGSPMQGFNKSADEPTEILLFQVQDEGEPLMYVAE